MCSCSIGSADRSFSSRYQWLCMWISCRIAFPSFVRDTYFDRDRRVIHSDFRAFDAAVSFDCITATESVRYTSISHWIRPSSRSKARVCSVNKPFPILNSVIETKRSCFYSKVFSSYGYVNQPGYICTHRYWKRCYSTSTFCIEYSSLIQFRIVLWCFVRGVFVQTSK